MDGKEICGVSVLRCHFGSINILVGHELRIVFGQWNCDLT